jgi:hypothetical protein
MDEQQYLLEVEGKSGTTADFELTIFDQKVSLIENAEILSTDERGRLKIRVAFPGSKERYIKVILKMILTSNS